MYGLLVLSSISALEITRVEPPSDSYKDESFASTSNTMRRKQIKNTGNYYEFHEEIVDRESEIAISTSEPSIAPTISIDSSRSSNPSQTPSIITCESGEILFRVELLTDRFPYETTWTLKDIFTDTIVKSNGPYSYAETLHKESYCLDLNSCIEFTINDSFGDGICCGVWGNGYVKAYYGDSLMLEAKIFAATATSSVYGDLCNSPAPSLSAEPSAEPTLSLTAQPSISASPTDSQAPSQGPTTFSVVDFSTDNNGRRRFPPIALDQSEQENWFSFEPIPNCTLSESFGRVGCIAHPSNISPPTPPDWSGNLYFKPPTCKLIDGRRQCSLGFPMSKNVYPHLVSNFELEKARVTDLDDGSGVIVNTNAAVAIDMDGDGNDDVIFGTDGSQNQILYGDGKGNFDFYPLPGGDLKTYDVAIGDMNGDDAPDIVLGNSEGKNHLLLNNGYNDFEMVELPDSISDTYSIALGDVDQDGNLDVLIGNSLDQPNVLLMNKGDLSFEIHSLPNTTIAKTSSVALGDIDDNGEIDLIFGNDDHTNQLLLNRGGNDFDAVELVDTELKTQSISVGDVDGDGMLDLVMGNQFEPNVLLRNIGDAAFERVELPGGSRQTQIVALIDLDGDGLLDMLIGNNDETNQVFMNRGNDIFDPYDLPGGSQRTRSFAIANIDENGKKGIIIGNSSSNNQVLVATSVGDDFSVFTFPFDAKQSRGSTVADFDGNGYADLIVANVLQQNQIYLNQGDGSFIAFDISNEPDRATTVAVGDLDGDGFSDVVLGKDLGPNSILFNTGDNKMFTAVELPESRDTKLISVADIDGDGRLDIIEGNHDTYNYIHFNNGNREFEDIRLPGGNRFTKSTAICDMDANGQLDLLIGNTYGPNLLLINKGDKSFDVITLPGGDSRYTEHIGAADLNNDGKLDIIILNSSSSDQILMNDGGGTFTEIILEGNRDSISASIGDLDGNGYLDIVIAQINTNNQILWNRGSNIFERMDLPGGAQNSRGSKIVDINDDGAVDIIFINYNQPSQVLLYNPIGKSCPNGGARLHGASWCFQCLSYMGSPTFLGEQVSSCVECIADEEQISGQCNSLACLFSHRPLGHDKCEICPNGTFYNRNITRSLDDVSTWNSTRCFECAAGHYSDGSLLAVDECYPCRPGFYQPKPGEGSCLPCEKGMFQPESGQSKCEECILGGYCAFQDTCGGGYTSCPPGTFNDEEKQFDASACKNCTAGTFSTNVGATSEATCQLCPKGTFTKEDGQTKCNQCPPGFYQPNEGQTFCIPCAPGTFADNFGFVTCSRCPSRLYSLSESQTCGFCQEGYYLDESNAGVEDIFNKPDNYCKECPLHAECPHNSTLETLVVPPNFWRDSSSTSTLYPCNNNACRGSRTRESGSKPFTDPDPYCILDHKGPLCQVCSDSKYFKTGKQCEDCPTLWRLTIPVAIIVGIFLALTCIWYASKYFECFDSFLQKLFKGLSSIGLQAKFKILISFIQIINTLDDVYGVEVDDKLSGWIDFLRFFNFGIVEMSTVNGNCIGSMRVRIIIGALWPFLITFFSFGGIALYRRRKRISDEEVVKGQLWLQLLSTSIIILYLVLPSVSNRIFDAKKCQPFETNDGENKLSSYLIADKSVKCDGGNKDYQQLQTAFWTMFTLWLILIPLGFLGLLLKIKGSVQDQRITPLADACSFLWRDYTRQAMFWEIFDLVRKIFLTGFIMFIDTQEGSSKILRLLVASIFSTFYLTLLLHACPYERRTDQILAYLSNLMLVFCFILGVVIQHCQGDQDVCHELIGFNLNSFKASLLVIILVITMLVLTMLFIIILGLNYTPDPTVKHITGENPVLDLERKCKYHAFVSHVWSTGQDKTHAMVRKLQLYIPGIKIWLDVVNLASMDELEVSVEESAIFILMFTDGYFTSKNCRRELYAAVTLDKPMILIYEGNDESVSDVKERCFKYCIDGGPSAESVWNYIKQDEPLLWLGAKSRYFSTASVKELSGRILSKLPYYNRNSEKLELGLKVGDELKVVEIPHECTVLFSKYNLNAEDIALEVKQMATNPDRVNVDTFDSYSDGSTMINQQHFLLLYLNEAIFEKDAELLEEQVKSAIDDGLKLILVHETDTKKGGKPFNFFFGVTPRALLAPPYKLFDEIAVTLYTFEEYRKVSLRMIILDMKEALEANNGLRKKTLEAVKRVFSLSSNNLSNK